MGNEPRRGSRRQAGELETEVLAALWAADRSLTAMQIRDAVDDSLAYNTVHTVVTRLATKRMIIGDPNRRGAWRPAADPAEQAAQMMTRALARGPDRDAVLQRFVGRLNPSDKAALQTLLALGRQ